MVLSILIASTVDRREMTYILVQKIKHQIYSNFLFNVIEIIVEEDNKEMSIGAKRQLMIEKAKGKFVVHFDSDDMPTNDYVTKIYQAIIDNPDIDCIGINVSMTTNGKHPQKCCHSLKYPEWKTGPVDGWDYVRNITHFNPVLRELALKAGFKDIRYGEDIDYATRLYPMLKKEFYIDEPLFHYRYSSKEPHKQKYGIK